MEIYELNILAKTLTLKVKKVYVTVNIIEGLPFLNNLIKPEGNLFFIN